MRDKQPDEAQSGRFLLQGIYPLGRGASLPESELWLNEKVAKGRINSALDYKSANSHARFD